jgi:hypothetical protein
MNFAIRLTFAIALLVIGIATLVGCLIADMEGGPSWLHALTWTGGALTATGVSLIRLAVNNRVTPVTSADQRRTRS